MVRWRVSDQHIAASKIPLSFGHLPLEKEEIFPPLAKEDMIVSSHFLKRACTPLGKGKLRGIIK